MKLEEIVALSVKHNVSDLHLCNSAAPRWRRQGRLEPAPFPAPDIAEFTQRLARCRTVTALAGTRPD